MKKFSLTAVLLSAALCLAACGISSSPEATAKRFYKAIADGDYSRALEYTDLDEEDTELYYALMEKARLSVEEKGGIKKIEVEELPDADGADEDPQHAVVFARISYADGSSQEEYCEMVSTDGKWRVDVDLNSK